MAKFSFEMPKKELEQLEWVRGNALGICAKMTEAGARAALKNVKANVPSSWRGSNIMNNITISKNYLTPSDGAVNTAVVIKGYFINENGEEVAAPAVANVFEYGRSANSGNRGGPITKRPFFRKAFKKDVIEKAMLAEQKRLMGEIFDE